MITTSVHILTSTSMRICSRTPSEHELTNELLKIIQGTLRIKLFSILAAGLVFFLFLQLVPELSTSTLLKMQKLPCLQKKLSKEMVSQAKLQ